MAQDKVQLKREEVVGNDIVTEDIYPATTTSSIEDDTKGVPLDDTLARMWNAINNKLMRVVNSVNGRTGVVILDANDVGLGNVDNISFNDIKQWVIDNMAEMFAGKRILIRTYLSEIQTIVGSNDKAYADVPFFTEYGEETTDDKLSYIGFIYWDDDDSQLKIISKAIRVIGYTDRSIIYNVNYDPEHNLDYSNGGIGVNIWSGEDSLKMRNRTISHGGHTPSDLRDSGLYIDKSNIVPNLYYYNGVYGNGNADDPDALLYYQLPTDTSSLKTISFKYKNDTTVWGPQTLYTKQTFKVGDMLYCNFADPDEYYQAGSPRTPKTGMASWLLVRQPCLGTVTVAPTLDHPEYNYTVEWVEVKPLASNGLRYSEIHDSDDTPSTTKLTIGTITDPDNINENFSGITTFSEISKAMPGSADLYMYQVMMPNGMKTFGPGNQTRKYLKDGLTVNLADSLCMIPVNASLNMPTWPKSVSSGLSYTYTPPHERVCDVGSFIGVNLMKSLPSDPETGVIAPVNKSGLRIDTVPNPLTHSGGLSVNAGDFLVIGKPEDDIAEITSSNYYNYGKLHVNVDTSKGLGDVGDGKLGITVYNQGGLTFNSGMLSVNPGKFISIDETTNTVDVNVDKKYGLKDVNNNNTLCINTNEHQDCLYFRSISANESKLSVKKGMGLMNRGYSTYGRDTNHDLACLYTEPDNWGRAEFWRLDGLSIELVTFTGSGTVTDPYVPAFQYDPQNGVKYYEVITKLKLLTEPREEYPSDWGTEGVFFELDIDVNPKLYKPVVFENIGYINPQYEPNKYYRRDSNNNDNGYLSVYLADSLTGTRDIVTANNVTADMYYGGLRYLQNMYGGEGVGIGIRINEELAWNDNGGVSGWDEHSYPSRHGSLGLTISDMNVLGIQLPETTKLKIDTEGCLTDAPTVQGIYAMCVYKLLNNDRSDLGIKYDNTGGSKSNKSLSDVLSEINYFKTLPYAGINWSPYNLNVGDILMFVKPVEDYSDYYPYTISKVAPAPPGSWGPTETYWMEDPARNPEQLCVATFLVEYVHYTDGAIDNASLYCTFSSLTEINVGDRLT